MCNKRFEKYAPQARWANSDCSAPSLNIWAAAALIFLAALLVYFPAINGDFIWDDDLHLTNNPLIKSSDGIYQFWSAIQKQVWPLSNASLWIEWRLWGMNPTGYHVTNLILHLVDALLIWIILRKLSIPGAFLAAMIFTVHPVNVESVAWIASRKNLLAMLFLLLSILWYLRFEISSQRLLPQSFDAGCSPADCAPLPAPRPLFYWLSLAASVLAMLSKGSAAVLPIILLGIIWWLRTGPFPISASEKMGLSPCVSRWDLIRIAPFFLIAAVLAGINVWFQKPGMDEVVRNAGFIERVLGAGGAVWFYLYKAVLPVNLCFVYPLWRISTGNLSWWLPLLAALAVTALLWRYRQGWSRPFLFAWGFFCASLIPVLGFADVGFMRFSLVADRYQHIAMIGVIALAAAGWDVWRRQLPAATRWLAEIAAVAAMGILVLLSSMQAAIYHDPITLYKTALKKNPDFWLGHLNLGATLIDAGRPQEAIEHCQLAMRLRPDYAAAMDKLGNTLIKDAENSLGNALLKSDRPGEAIEHYQKALQCKSNAPEVHNNLALALVKMDRLEEAIKHYQQALSVKPDFSAAHNNLGAALVRAGRLEEAIGHYQQALRLDPDYFDTYNNLGAALTRTGRMHEAIDCYRQALRLNPDYAQAHNNLGYILSAAGRLPEAIEHFRQALRLKPDFSEAHNNLGIALIQTNRPEEAIEHFQQLLRSNPEFVEGYANLALAYKLCGRTAAAQALLQKALDIARSKGNATMIKQLEQIWNSFSADQSTAPAAPPSPKPVSPDD